MQANNVEDNQDDKSVNTLLRDYELWIGRYGSSEERLLQFFAILVSILALISGYIIRTNSPPSLSSTSGSGSINPLMAWGISILFFGLICVLIHLYYTVESNIYRCRIIAKEINEKIGESTLTQFSPKSNLGRFFSIHRGNLRFRGNFYAIAIFIVTLYFGLNLYLAISLYGENHLNGTAFVFVFLIFSLLIFNGFLGVFRDLYNLSGKIYDGTINVIDLEDKDFTPFKGASIKSLLLPRPIDLQKSIFFVYGVVAAFVSVGFQPMQQLAVINKLFSTGVSFTPTSVPVWAVFLLLVTFFCVEELLWQQSKLIWDDIRDQERDRKIPFNKNRAIAAGNLSDNAALLQMAIRITLALALSYILSNREFIFLLFIIGVHQIVYALWIKPSGKKLPLLPLFWLGISVGLRVLAGFIALNGYMVPSIFTLLSLIIFYFFSFGYLAAYWKMESVYFHKENYMPRAQSGWFANNTSKANAIQSAGFLGAFVLSVIGFAMSRNQIALFYLTLDTIFDWSTFIFLFLALTGIVLIVALTIMNFISPVKKALSRIVRPSRLSILSPIFFFFALCILVQSFQGKDAGLYFCFLALINIGMFLYLENLSYEDLVAEEKTRQIPFLAFAWKKYLLRSNTNISFFPLISATIKILGNKTLIPKHIKLEDFSEDDWNCLLTRRKSSNDNS